MKLHLLDFQEEKAAELVKKVDSAQMLLRNDKTQTQAVILASPTGSGKTVMMAKALESIVPGDGERLPNSATTILWLSDSPELNEQSKQKFIDCSDVFPSGRLETIESSFDRRVLEPGKIYFINTQKFSSSSTLTRSADVRHYTIWQTLSNTIEECGDDFLLVIDEAHKGMLASRTNADDSEAQTIVQRFLFGQAGQILKVPLILGLSATPKRFNAMLDASNRLGHKVIIDPAVVRASGLLKYRLLIHCPVARQKHADDSLLREAAKNHLQMKKAWEHYCTVSKDRPVHPLLVVQVEDGVTKQELFSKTDLDQVVRSIREEMPGISPDALAHCFQDEGQVRADGIGIRKAEPSKLQDDSFAEIVLFKTALTTGWDCPRAETMMSYRTARDATMIEQLIGRMVRAPLARGIESNDALNTVRLYLPGFDRPAVQAIIKKLSDPENEESVATEIDDATGYLSYGRNQSAAEIFDSFPQLPTYRVPRSSQQSALVRLLKLVTRLSVSTKIQQDAKATVVGQIIEMLAEEADGRKGSPSFEATVGYAKEIRVEGHLFDMLANRYRVHGREVIPASDENVDQLFRAASRRLTSEEALGIAYWRERHNEDDPNRAKLEFYALVQEQGVRTKMEAWARDSFDELYTKHAKAIQALPAGKRRDIERLAGGQEKPIPSTFRFKDVIEIKRGPSSEDDHIYCTEDGEFHPTKKLNGWEQTILDEERKRPGFIGWFRNPEQGDDRVAICYKDGEGTWRTKSPDFLVFHKEKGSVVCSLVEPHDISGKNSWCIAQGMAEFAKEYSAEFERVDLTIEDGQKGKRLELAKPSWRSKALAVTSNEALKAVFAQIG
jgi:type III restriction enzyme